MNILLTSVGRRAYMIDYFKDVVDGDVHAANSEYTYAMQIADTYTITPLIYDPAYIDFLLSYCDSNDIKVVLSLFDVDLPVLSRNKQKFIDYGINLIVSDEEFVEVCNDKYLTFCWLMDYGFNSPNTYIDIDKCKSDLQQSKCAYPLVIKPRWGMGSIGIYEATCEAELDVFCHKVKRDIESTYLKYESKADLNKSVLIQEKLKGDEYGIDVFNGLNGDFLSCVPKKKLAMRSGETDSAIILNDKKLIDLSKKISKFSKHIANLDVDCFNVDGDYYVLEMNPRFGGQYPFSHLSGVNYPKVIIDIINNVSLDAKDLMPIYNIKGFKNLEPVILKR